PRSRDVPAPSAISTLSLHDALPIWLRSSTSPIPGPPSVKAFWRALTLTLEISKSRSSAWPFVPNVSQRPGASLTSRAPQGSSLRSEEHTSELQSRENLVCRLLLEKK